MVPVSCPKRAVVLLTAALALGFQASTAAHDPGLSALDVRVLPDRVVATLSLAPGDARLLVSERGDALEAIALDSIEMVLDGARLPGRVERRSTESEAGASVVLAFDGGIGARLTVRSSVPARLARGHRELLTVRGPDGALLAERMLDDRDGTVNLTMAPRGSALASQFFALGLRHILAGYDHLVFLAALLLGVRRLTSVVKTVTSFTVAHSLTLGPRGSRLRPPASGDRRATHRGVNCRRRSREPAAERERFALEADVRVRPGARLRLRWRAAGARHRRRRDWNRGAAGGFQRRGRSGPDCGGRRRSGRSSHAWIRRHWRGFSWRACARCSWSPAGRIGWSLGSRVSTRTRLRAQGSSKEPTDPSPTHLRHGGLCLSREP